MVRSKGISELTMNKKPKERRNKQTNRQNKLTGIEEESKKNSSLIGNRRRRQDGGNDTSVPPWKTHLKKKKEQEYTQQAEMLTPQCVSSCDNLARERKKGKEISREARIKK